jgi:hypothetical protein
MDSTISTNVSYKLVKKREKADSDEVTVLIQEPW